ncbi:hypothetical protein ALQ77_01729 [Pseudomonas corrugata]|uniref:Uncharacterized protein n=1 Tax=Pseudomonas corrugata TaxID=47879 RepID=A0A3M3E418_9PSED|nr:hypothetical protein ALQ77_01729 [Pseudomonas corrugata]
MAGQAIGAVDAGTQDFVARQQIVQAGVQRLDIEFALEVQGERDVEQRRARRQLLDEPQALLRERQRQQGRARLGFRCLEGDGLWRGGVGLASGDVHGQQGHGGLFEQRAQRQVEFEMVAQSRNDLGRQQRVATEGEEVVFHANGVAPQDLGPDGRHGGFQWIARGNASPGIGLPVQYPGGQGLAIDLAVVVQRQFVQADEGGRHHVRRQLCPQVLAQAVAAQGVVMGRPVRHQPGFTDAVFPQQHGGFAHVRVLREAVFDFGQFYPVAAQFHLLVAAAEVFDHPVCAPASQVTGAIHATFKLRMFDERFGGALRIVQVATADADATDTDFPGDTHRQRTQGFVQHIQAVVGGRLADGHVADVSGRGCEDRLERYVVGAFGRPVGIHQGNVGEAREPVPGHGRRQGFAGGQHPAQVRQLQVTRAQGEQGAHQARDDFQHAQAFAGEYLQQALRVVGDFVREDVHGGAEHWRGEELPHGNVECHRSGLRDPVLGAEPQGRDLAEDVVEHAPLFDHHALRRTGRTRGEKDVGEAVRAAESRQRRVVASLPAGFGEQRHGGLIETAEQRVEQRAAIFAGDQQRRAGQAEDLPQALGRMIDFQGQHGRAGLEHGNHHGQQRQAARGGQGDQLILVGTGLAQGMGQSCGALVQLGVGQGLAVTEGGDLSAALGDLVGKQLRVALIQREIMRIDRPIAQQLLAFFGGQQFETAQRRIWCRQHARHEAGDMAQQALDGGGFEAFAVIGHADAQLLTGQDHHGQAVVGVHAVVHAFEAELETAFEDLFVDGRVLEHQDAVKQGFAPGEVAPALDVRQGRVLKVAHVDVEPLQVIQPIAEGRIRVHRHPQRQGIDEQPDHFRDAGQVRRTTGHRDAEDHVPLAAVARQQQ